MGRVREVAAALALCLLLPGGAVGCSRVFGCVPAAPEDITVSDLAGVYAGARGARIELRDDGHYRVSGLGNDGEGTWALAVDSASSEDLLLDDLQLWISGDRADPWLYRFNGDPDRCKLIEFHRAR